MDLQINRTPPGTIGPAEDILNRYGQEKGSGCTGFVFGKHGNLSPAFIVLRDLIVNKRTNELAQYYNTPRAQVVGMLKSELSKCRGLTIARALAKFLLTRIQYPVLDYNTARGS